MMTPDKLNQFIIASMVLLALMTGLNHARHDLKLHTNLNLKLLTIISPPPCNSSSPVDFLYVVHTAPSHLELRDTLRRTWAHSDQHSGNTKRVFFIGRSNRALENTIMVESQRFVDIFMYDMADAYRNMTIKHVMVYQWSIEMCPTAKYVLKADDDTFVDTYHLSKFLKRYQFDNKENFLLCFVVKGNTPRRNEGDKWFVSKEEYEEDEYPTYCSGAAYVTKTKTMKRILSKLQTLNYLFIDDVLVTGLAAQHITSHYDWSNSFLETHMGEQQKLLSSEPYFTPELMAAMDLNSTNILTLFQKTRLCTLHASSCYERLTGDIIQRMRPLKVASNHHRKNEL